MLIFNDSSGSKVVSPVGFIVIVFDVVPLAIITVPEVVLIVAAPDCVKSEPKVAVDDVMPSFTSKLMVKLLEGAVLAVKVNVKLLILFSFKELKFFVRVMVGLETTKLKLLNLGNQFSFTSKNGIEISKIKALEKESIKVLREVKGYAFIISPIEGKLKPFEEKIIILRFFNEIPGQIVNKIK